MRVLAVKLSPFSITIFRGTERQNVADDYAKRLHIGQVECETLIGDIAGTYISGKSGSSPPKFQTCEYLNVSVCPIAEKGNVSVHCISVLSIVIFFLIIIILYILYVIFFSLTFWFIIQSDDLELL